MLSNTKFNQDDDTIKVSKWQKTGPHQNNVLNIFTNSRTS